MTTHLVTFASIDMAQSALLCELSAKVQGADSSVIWNPHMLTEAGFYANTIEQAVCSGRRGCNFWKWKPFVIAQEMSKMEDGSICIYSDAGVEFINSVNYIIDRMSEKRNRIVELRRKAEPIGPQHSAWDEIIDLESTLWTDDIFLFGNQYEHAHWCKRDIVEAVWPLGGGDETMEAQPPIPLNESGTGRSWKSFGKQVQASVIFFRVNDKTRAFVKEWLDWCLFEGGRLIDDSPSRLPNHPEFQENRHDQSILTTMAYRDGYKLHWWPASYNDGTFEYPRGDYPDEGYPILFNHHRRRQADWGAAA